MHTPKVDPLLGGLLILALAVCAMPAGSAAGERHAGTVLGVDSRARTLMLDEFGANAVRRTFEVRVSGQAQVLRSERHEPVTDFSEVFKDTPIDLADIRPGDFIIVELAEKPNVADRVIVTLGGGAE